MFGIGNIGALGRVTGSGGGSSSLPTFAYQPETTALVAAMTATGATVSQRRQKSIDWAIRTMKGANKNSAAPWSKVAAFWKVGNEQATSLINWALPGTHNLTVVNGGTPLTFNANVDWSPGGNGSYLETGIALNSLDMTKAGIAYYTTTAGASATECGAVDGSGNGLSLNMGVGGARCGGAPLSPMAGEWGSTPNTTITDGGMIASRQGSAGFNGYFNGINKGANTQTNATITATATIALMGYSNNGSHANVATHHQTCWVVLSNSLTDAEAEVLGNVMAQLYVEFAFGELDTYEAGYAPTTANYDVVVYGMTSQAYMAAYEAKRAGKNVCIVGGWRDRNLNGMAAAGLGHTDIGVPAGSGGLPRWVFTQIQAIQGTASTNFQMLSKNFDRVIRGMLDPRITNGLDIPVYWSGGVTSVTKTPGISGNPRITSITTADGRTFSAKRFIDCSYELDLGHVSGVSTILGRESSAAYSEGLAGRVERSLAASTTEFTDHTGAVMSIDPYVTPATPASGMLPLLTGTALGVASNGIADGQIQDFGYRPIFTTTAPYTKPVAPAAPANYNALMYEPLGRQLAADTSITLSTILLQDTIFTGYVCLNNTNGQSLDYHGRATPYMAASYANREAIVQDFQTYLKGLFYFLLTDPRVPAGIVTSLNVYGWANDHFHRPHPNDDFQFPIALYVREGYRLVNDFMWRQSDLQTTDGTTPRSTNTIAATTYTLIDEHFVQALVDPTGGTGGTARISLEGGVSAACGGTDGIVPVPMEIAMPRQAECENLLCVFGGGMTHIAFGPYRMEITTMQVAQSCGRIASMTIDAGDEAVQAIDPAALRTALLASNTLPGETAPVLPQVN